MARPTTANPRSAMLSLRLTQTELDALEEYARAQGMGRSDVVRAAIKKMLKKGR